ncbi:MAG: GNAT family N-acetyltransferase [Bacteroidota bacterium]
MAFSLQILAHDELDPDQWDAFIRQSPQGSLYALHGYLSSVKAEWRAYVIHKKGVWCAVMPFCLNHRWQFRSLPQPLYTQYWGVCFAPMADLVQREQLRRKGHCLKLLVDAWQDIHLVVQNFSPHFDYPLPFHWGGYELQNRYTYWLDLAPEESTLLQGIEPSLRRQIKKFHRNQGRIQPGKLSQLMDLIKVNQEAGHDVLGGKDPDFATLERINSFLDAQNLGACWVAEDASGSVLAAACFARYQQQGLYLLGAQHPAHKSSGAMTALLWEGICQTRAAGGRYFDFEGSMLPGVEPFFRKFGAYPVPYLQIRKNHLPRIVKWLQSFT